MSLKYVLYIYIQSVLNAFIFSNYNYKLYKNAFKWF